MPGLTRQLFLPKFPRERHRVKPGATVKRFIILNNLLNGLLIIRYLFYSMSCRARPGNFFSRSFYGKDTGSRCDSEEVYYFEYSKSPSTSGHFLHDGIQTLLQPFTRS